MIVDGLKIAKRGKGRVWISLEPGWRVLDKNYGRKNMQTIVEFDGDQVAVH